MVAREKILRELRFVGDNLGGRTEILDEIGREYADAYKILSDNPRYFRVNKKNRLGAIPYGRVWDAIDEMKGKGITGCEIAARLIKKYQPHLPDSPDVPLALDMFHTTRYGS